MKEPFVNVDVLADLTKLLGDMELQAYLSSLSDSQKNQFISSNVGETIRAVDASKSSKFNDLIDQATGADNNIVSASYYTARTKDLSSLARDMNEMTVKQLDVAQLNSSVSLRQNEINEWSNYSKLDTLFFMQVLFVSLSLAAILAFLLSKNLIGHSLFVFVCGVITMIAMLTLLLRWRYSNVVRDGRYWHKNRYPRQNFKAESNICNT